MIGKCSALAADFARDIFKCSYHAMPLYEYQCKKCHYRFEKIQKFSDKPMKKCPDCGGPVEQLISAPAVQFKGSGWYVTDYPKKGSTAPSSFLRRRFRHKRHGVEGLQRNQKRRKAQSRKKEGR